VLEWTSNLPLKTQLVALRLGRVYSLLAIADKLKSLKKQKR
jgi:hypothetical protein